MTDSTHTLRRACADDAHAVAVMVGELLQEITCITGTRAFNFDLADTTGRLQRFLDQEKYFVFIADDSRHAPAGFVALCESYALYAEGAYGTIPELFVRPDCRSQGIGLRLLEAARSFGVTRGWRRLEVTTPPLPAFDRTLAFYRREGFTITGGRKLKLPL